MTVNNNPNALPSVAVIVHRCLSSHDSAVERDQLIRLIAPPAVVGHQASDQEATLKTLALLEEFDCLTVRDEKYSLHPDLMAADRSENDVNHLRRAIRKRFLARRFNVTDDDTLWDSDKGARDFTRATAWFLMQDIWFGPRVFDGDISQAQNEQLIRMPNRKQPMFNTSIRWDAFCRWAVFLGFAVRETKGVLPDPTSAVRDAIDAFPTREVVPLQALLTYLAMELPVIDGGEYRGQVEEKRTRVDNQGGSGQTSQELSPTLSHAMLRLGDANVLELALLDDAESKHTLSGVGARRNVYSHVRVLGA